MAQWSVRMRVERFEIWTVEAESEKEARAKAYGCETVDEQSVDIVDWVVLGVKEDK